MNTKIAQRMKEMLNKRMDVASTFKIKSLDEKNRTIDYIISTDDPDRHNEIVDQVTMSIPDTLPFLLHHDQHRFPIGKWMNFRQEAHERGGLQTVATAHFSKEGVSQEADQAWEHAKSGEMNTISIGFMPKRIEWDEEKELIVLYDCELLEGSLVNVPANKFAVAKSMNEKIAGLSESDRKMLMETSSLIEKFLSVGENVQVADNVEVKQTESSPIDKGIALKRAKAKMKHQMNRTLRRLNSR